jgi:hypothetical protein
MGDLTSLASLGLNAALATQAARRSEKQAKKDAERQVGEIRARDAAEDQERRRRLRAAIARERARAGAAGVITGGSTEAVLRGLTEEAEAEARAADAVDAERIDRLRDGARRSSRRNLLDLAGDVVGASTRSTGFRTAGRSLLDD